MKAFYYFMLVRNQAPAHALQSAQKEMWQERRWRDPVYWAPFVLYGD
jgi:CHAT domain-containing protein